jgi:competence protein ComEC
VHLPAVVVAVPLLTGSAIGLLLYGPAADGLAYGATGGAVLCWLAALAAFGDHDPWLCGASVGLGAALCGAVLGLDAAARAYAPPIRCWFDAVEQRGSTPPLVLEGVLRGDAAPGEFGVSLLVEVTAVRLAERPGDVVPVAGGVRLSVAGSRAPALMAGWRAGRRIRVAASLREPTVYFNPGRADDRRALARRGVILVGSVKSGALVEVVARADVVTELAAAVRAWCRVRLTVLVGRWSARSGGIAAAILVGDRTGLSPDDERRLQEAGTYHVVAISGGNIALLTLLLLGTAHALRAPPRASAAVAIAVLLLYGRIAGPAPSVDRAIVAAVFYLAGRLIDHRGPPINILAVAAIIAVAAAPAATFDPGFLLSFGATLGILVLVPRFLEWVRTPHQDAARDRTGRRRRAWVGTLAGPPAATLAAEIVLAPIGAGLFGRVTFAGLVLNFAAIPLMAIVQSASMAALGLSVVSLAAGAQPGYVAHLAAAGLVESARLVDLVPWLSLEVPAPAWPLLACYYAVVALAVLWRRARLPASIAAAVCGALLLIGPRPTTRGAPPPPRPGWLRVVVLDVGQGDATLVRLPDGRAYLVDAAGIPAGAPADGVDGAAAFDVGDRVVAPAIRTLGVRRLDTFVLTHPDPDHLGGGSAIVRRFHPRAVWEGVPVPPHQPRARLAAAADAIGAEWRAVQAGERLRVGATSIRVLHPPRPDWERQRVRNEDSVVLDVRLGRVSIVLPGDIGREGERAILPALDPASIVVLKAAHHGSATSSTPEFLSALKPKVVIFSAGRANRFGHPAPPVVARFRALGSAIFSTAEDGAVFVETDGAQLVVWGWRSRRRVEVAGPLSRGAVR